MKPVQTNAQTQQATSKNAWPLGEAFALIERLGTAESLESARAVAAGLSLPQIEQLPDLKAFLEAYDRHLLRSVEFPIILRAYGHVTRGQARELVELDQQIKSVSHLTLFANASRQIGCQQLERLRPLRDHRVVQRYLAALDANQASGWHPVVFGMAMAVYSLPMRQALLHYGEETLAGLAMAAAKARHFSDKACREILDPLIAGLPAAIDQVLLPQGPTV